MARQYWLMKSEPGVYSIDDLEADGTTCWEGVRNYEARNNMRAMKEDDLVLFYHSATSPPHVAGIARVVKEAYPDHFAFQKGHDYYDAKSDPHEPRWYMVDVGFAEKFEEPVTLAAIKDRSELDEMALVNRMRLSVQPVTKDEFRIVKRMAGKKS